jgi:hypothetical protein
MDGRMPLDLSTAHFHPNLKLKSFYFSFNNIRKSQIITVCHQSRTRLHIAVRNNPHAFCQSGVRGQCLVQTSLLLHLEKPASANDLMGATAIFSLLRPDLNPISLRVDERLRGEHLQEGAQRVVGLLVRRWL